MPREHYSIDPGVMDEDGFYQATCVCGFHVCGLPDEETMVDVLMEHAYDAGRNNT